MTLQSDITQGEAIVSQELPRKILIITSFISTLFGALYLIGLLGKLLINGSIHAQSSPAISMVSAVIGLLWDVTLVILFVALRAQLRGKRVFYADLGVVFMVMLGAVSSINWYVQFTLVPVYIRAGDSNALALLDVHNVDSLMYAIEHLAWGLFFGLAAIFMALAIEGDKLDRYIRWLLITAGIMSILFIPGRMIGSQILVDLGYYAAGILLPITTILLIIRYRRK